MYQVDTSLLVRPARPADKDAVIAFCQHTFDWGDYVPDAWDRWLADPDGKMLVGVVEDRPIAVIHVSLLDDHAAWMEGMRVHPDFRRQAIGTRLDRAGREYARSQGCQVARLATSIENLPAQAVLAREGYTRIAQFNSWESPPAQDNHVEWRIAGPRDLDALLTLYSNPDYRPPGAALFPTAHWTWSGLTRTRMQRHVDAGQVRVSSAGFAVLVDENDEESKSLTVLALVGDIQTLSLFGNAARAEARYRGFPRVAARIIDDARFNHALESSGYVREGALLIYERSL